jgi:hypothetical protein
VSFPWLTSNLSGSPAAAAARVEAQRRDLRDRAALYFRLGYTPAAAIARLTAAVAWEHDPSSRAGGRHRRPAGLSDAAIAELVQATFARRPSGPL